MDHEAVGRLQNVISLFGVDKVSWRFSVSGRPDASARNFSADYVEWRQSEVVLTLKALAPNDRSGRGADGFGFQRTAA